MWLYDACLLFSLFMFPMAWPGMFQESFGHTVFYIDGDKRGKYNVP